MATDKTEITFELGRIEDLSKEDRARVEELPGDVKQGLVIKEYKSNSFVRLRRFMPIDRLFTSEVNKNLTKKDRSFISELGTKYLQ